NIVSSLKAFGTVDIEKSKNSKKLLDFLAKHFINKLPSFLELEI
ncbi:14715_t:CDS:1, partial [Acaulospora morrowiae]